MESTVHPHIPGQNSTDPYYDNRLYRICQVPQLPYMEKNPKTGLWQPTKDAVELVKKGLLYVEKNGQKYEMQNISYPSNEIIQKTILDNVQFQEIEHKENFMNTFNYQNDISEDEKNILKLNLIGNSYARHTDLERFGQPNEIGKGKDMLINFTTCDGKNMELKTKDDVTSYVIEMQSKINSMKNYISKDELKDLKKLYYLPETEDDTTLSRHL